MSFQATHLGHRSWIVADEQTAIAVDPVLGATVGRPKGARLIYPPRILRPEWFPPLNAIVLTCESEEHVDLASIALIVKSQGPIPVFVTARVSTALRTAIQEAGLETRVLEAFIPATVGGFEIASPGSKGTVGAGILIWSRTTGASFTRSGLGTWNSEWRWLRELGVSPKVIVLSSSTIDLRFQRSWDIIRHDPAVDMSSRALDAWKKIAARWSPPKAIVIENAGISFGGDVAWMNREAFPSMTDLGGGVLQPSLLTTVAGDVFVLRDGAVERLPASAPFIEVASREQWPHRMREGQCSWIEHYSPASGRLFGSEADRELIARELAGFARHLYGRALFKGLLSVEPGAWYGRRPTFVLALLEGEGKMPTRNVMEYSLQRRAFVPCDVENAAVEFGAVFECWTTDLAAMFRGEIDLAAIEYGRCRFWNARPDRFRFDLIDALREYTHALRQPERALNFYRGVVGSCA